MKVAKKKKSVTRKTPRNRTLFKGGAKNGALYAIGILAVVAAFGGVMAGGVLPTIVSLKTPPPPPSLYSCCDSGDGPNCHPIMETQITFNGDAYALLKSNIYQGESGHIAPTNEFTPDGHRIFINTSNVTAHHANIPGCEPGKDLIGIKDPSAPDRPCFGIPHNELLYVCKDTQVACNQQIRNNTQPFDVYFRIKDGQVPNEIASFCPKPKDTSSQSPQQIIGVPTPGGRKDLQLDWFQVQQGKTQSKWLGAWCKPADYFYPPVKTDIHFDVKPQGEFVSTAPQYQPGGWNFSADPDGTILYQGTKYPYIYWDAAIPNNLISIPKDGYAVSADEFSPFLNYLLPQLGLSEQEANEFTAYWTKTLPKSNYYFVGIIPQNQIDSLAPMTVEPTPDSILRVTLYFKLLDKKIDVATPQLTSFTRKGFTVVEWGAIFDTQNHPGFSCLM